MKKKLFAAALIGAVTLSFAACGGGTSSAGSSSAEAPSSAETTAEPEAEPASAGETHDVGAFTILVPAGWFGFDQTDYMADPDEDGTYPVSTTSYGMIKDGKQEMDLYSKPCVYVYYYDDTTAENQSQWATWAYDESEEIDVTVNGKKAFAYRVKSDYSEAGDGSDVYVNDVVLVEAGENACFQYNITVSTPEFEGLSADDPDVMAIMESAVPK